MNFLNIETNNEKKKNLMKLIFKICQDKLYYEKILK